MFERSLDALTSLHQRGLLELEQFDVGNIRKQMRTYSSLMERSRGTSNTRNFLAEYDALMRLVEVILICSKFRFGPQPHRVLKEVVASLCPNSEIQEIVSARHDAKKMAVEPRQVTQDQLHLTRQTIESEVQREIRPLLDD